jgi:hypothetical protein
MELNPEQQKTIETFGGLNYPAEKIAMILDMDREQFLVQFGTPDADPAYQTGNIRYHYDRGQLMAQAEIDKANLRRAKDGNQTSIAQYKKDVLQRDVENAKLRTVYQQEGDHLEALKIMIEKGDIKGLTTIQVEFIDQIDYIRGLHLRWRSKPFIVNAVRMRWPNLSKIQVGKLYNDTLNFFYLDNDVKIEAWRNIYAEKLDNLAALALDMNDGELSRRCIADAAGIRGVNKEVPPQVPPEVLDRRPVFYTIDITKLGIPKIDRPDLASLIDNLDLSREEKNRFKREAMIEDVPFELIIDDEKDQDNN